MAKIDSKLVEEYERTLAADPGSKVFAILGEIYREMGLLERSERLLRRGIAKHPDYAAGYLVLGKLFLQKKEVTEGLQLLRKVVELSPDNLLAFQLMGEAYLQQKKPKEALKAYKMVLFLSPIHPRAQQVVASLERVSADEYEEELFTLRAHNQELPLEEDSASSEAVAVDEAGVLGKGAKEEGSIKEEENVREEGNIKDMSEIRLERFLSFIDALIVRGQYERARRRLLEIKQAYPVVSEIDRRLKLLEAPIQPAPSKEKKVIEEKIRRLKGVLAALDSFR